MKWLRRIAVVVLVLVALLGVLVIFIFGTERGARFTLARIVAATEGRLTIGTVEGRLPAALTMTNVRYRDPASGVDVGIERLVVDIGATSAFLRRARIESLDAEGVAVALTSVRDDEPSSPWQPPLDVVVERAQVERVTIVRDGKPLPRIDRVDAAGRWTNAGIEIARLDVRGPDGRLDLAGQFASARGHRGRARGSFAWRVDGIDWAGTVDATSDGRTARGTVVLRAPMTATAQLTLAPADDALPWTIVLTAPPFDPAALGIGRCTPEDGADCAPSSVEAISAKLEGSGDRGRFALTGDVAIDGRRLRLERFDGTLRGDELVLDALRVASPDVPGALEAKGRVLLAPAPARATLDLVWREVVLPAGIAGRTLATAGTARFEGSAENHAAQGRFTFGPPDRSADVALALRRDGERVTIESIEVVQAQGGLEGSGTVTLGEATSWSLDARATRLDPGAFFAEWPGALDFTLATTGTRRAAGIEASVELTGLAGSLRERAVAGEADVTIAPGNVVEGTATLRSGASRIALVGRGGATTDVEAKVAIASLADLWPGSTGSVNGDVRVRGAWPAVDLDADLAVENLSHRGTRFRSGTLRARIVNVEDPSGALSFAAQDAEVGALRFETLALEADGSAEGHRFALDASGQSGSIELALDGRRDEAGWHATLPTLALDLPGVSLALQSPARVGLVDDTLVVAESCFTVTEAAARPRDPAQSGRACIASDIGRDRSAVARYRVERVPVALLVALASPGSPVRTEGVLDGSGEFARAAGGDWRGNASLRSEAGLVAYAETSEQPLLRYTGLVFDAALAPGSGRATARAALDEGGSLDAEVTLAGEALGGRIDLVVGSLRFLELVTPEIANPTGRLEAHYRLAGTRAAPRLDGSLALTDFGAEVPAAGLTLANGRASLRATGDDAYVIEGSVDSGGGTLRLDGTGGLGAETPLTLALTGENVLASDVPGVKIVASPALTLTRDARRLRLRGTIALSSASINLARLPGAGATRASRDVVVLDEGATAEARAATPLDTDVTIVLGEDVAVRGLGLEGEIEGRLRVRERPGRAPTGTGQIRVSGTYRAYGQNLTIERGRLLFAQSPLDDPGLDIRAVRKLREVTPGLRIEGSAKSPVLTVFSNPPMEQGNALSYLVTGRPLRNLSGEDGDTVGMAARALGTATGDLLAKRIGAKMGVDDIGVAESDSLGGAAFTVGKYLSPRLYVSYGIGVFDPGTVVTMRYELTDQWELEASSGTVESRAGVNYKIERD